jgi:hypothetical protein
MTDQNDPNDLFREVIEENPGASEAELRAIFISAVETSPHRDAYLRVMVREFFFDEIARIRKERAQ